MKRTFFIGIFLTVLCFSNIANAAFVDYGNNLIYDTDQNITWYNAPETTRMTPWGEVTGPQDGDWQTVTTWAENLAAGGVNTGWRLPSIVELRSLYNNVEKPIGYTSPFNNLRATVYWSGTSDLDPDYKLIFNFDDGSQSSEHKEYWAYNTLAVHSDNIASPVPIPAAVWLLGTGLVGFFGVRRRFAR